MLTLATETHGVQTGRALRQPLRRRPAGWTPTRRGPHAVALSQLSSGHSGRAGMAGLGRLGWVPGAGVAPANALLYRECFALVNQGCEGLLLPPPPRAGSEERSSAAVDREVGAAARPRTRPLPRALLSQRTLHSRPSEPFVPLTAVPNLHYLISA